MKWSIYLKRVFSPVFCVILIIAALCALIKMPGESLENQNYFLLLLLAITMFYGVIKSYQLDPVGLGRTIVCVLLLGVVNLAMLFSSGWQGLDFLTLIGFLIFVFWLIFNGYSLANFTTEETKFSPNSLISNIKSDPEAQHLIWELFKHLAYMIFLGLCFYLFRFEILVLVPFIDDLLQGNGLFQIEEFLRGLIVLFVLMYGFMFSLLKASLAWEKLILCGSEK